MVVESILDSLRMKGPAEAEIVKRFKFQKINGLRIDGVAEQELNEMLNTTLLQILGGGADLVNEALLPALISFEK